MGYTLSSGTCTDELRALAARVEAERLARQARAR